MAVTAMAVMALAATEATAMERGPPMLMLRLSLLPRPSLRLMPTMAATAMVATDTARGPLMPMPTTAATAMAVMALAMVATDTARGLLMPMPTMAATAMAVTAMAATATASKQKTSKSAIASLHQIV